MWMCLPETRFPEYVERSQSASRVQLPELHLLDSSISGVRCPFCSTSLLSSGLIFNLFSIGMKVLSSTFIHL